MFCDGLVQRRA